MLSICAFCSYVKTVLGVMICHRCIVNLSQGYMYPHYMCHSAICETDLVSWYSIDLLSIGVGGYMYSQHMYIMIYVKLIWCNGIPLIYCELEVWKGS